ncbi:MAG: hypothetical protein AAF629_30705 [Chloroflexota bacterium]
MIETIQQAVVPHDQYQIEIKLDYSLLEGKQTHYQISTFMFVPRSLGISPHNYRKEDFYKDVQNYIRLKTPIFALNDFTTQVTSPLVILKTLVTAENKSVGIEKSQVVDNCKLFSAMLKSAVREHIQLIQRRISEAPSDANVQLMIQSLVEAFLVESEAITSEYRALYDHFNLPNVDGELFTAYKLTDESMSLLIEESAIEIFAIVIEIFKKEKKAKFKSRLNDCAEKEVKYRRAHGYASVLEIDDNENEAYAFRISVLKKYASSVLYLSTALQREGVGLEQILFALAAGLSMIFATVVAFYFQAEYGNFTFPFFVALVVGYMFKDRIKEWGRATFSRYLQNRLFDRRIIIHSQDGKHKLGMLKENVTFVDETELPQDAVRARNRSPLTELDNDGLGEDIICYTKEIKLYNQAFRKAFHTLPEITGINDIIRYDIRAFLNKMDEPVQEKAFLAKEQLQHAFLAKVYHVNLITRYRSLMPRQPKVYRRIRMILHRTGIKRLEQVEV